MELKFPIKILFVQHSGLISGSFISLIHLIKGLNIGIYSVEVLFLEKGPAIDEIKNMGIKTYVCHTAKFWTCPGPRFISLGNLRNYLSLIPNFKVRKLIKGISPAIIHINDKAALNVGISSIGMGIPIVQHIRSTFYIIDAKVNKYIQRLAIKLYATALIGITESETEEFKTQHAKTIYNSLDLSNAELATSLKEKTKKELKLNENYINVGWVASCSKRKGLWDFLEIAKVIINNNPTIKIRFYLIAKFPDEHQEEYDENTNSWYKIKDKLLGYLDDELLSNYIVMLGYRHDYLNIMAALDIVVNCNRLGSIGRQAFETMAVGTLCIATHRNPETTRLIINNKNGYIVKEGDILHMIELIIKLYKNKVELENIALNGMKYAHQEFSSKIQTNKIQLIYNQILNR